MEGIPGPLKRKPWKAHDSSPLSLRGEQLNYSTGEKGYKNFTPLNLIWTYLIIRIRSRVFSSCRHETVH